MRVIYLVRHAESAPHADLPEADWPLSERGAGQARELARPLVRLGIGEVHSSPYRRAVDTVAPFAAAAGLDVRLAPGLRERKLVPRHVVDFFETAERAWRDFRFALPGCESSADCQARMLRTVEEVTGSSRAPTVLLSSHGNAIGLLLNALTGGRFGYEDWLAMPRPALYRLELSSGALRFDDSFGLDWT